MTNRPKGSQWRKWDLHVHSPASSGFSGDWNQFVIQLGNADCDVIGINDYFSVAGYREILRRLSDPGAATEGNKPYREALEKLKKKTLIPVVECRMNNILLNKQGKSGPRINFHLIFSPDLNPDDIETFIKGLKADGSSIGARYSDSQFLLEKVSVPFQETCQALRNDGTFAGRFLVWLPYDEYGGIDAINPSTDKLLKERLICDSDILGSPLSHSFLSGLTSHELFLTAVAQVQFSTLIQEAFSRRNDPQSAQNVDSAITEIRSLLSQPEGRPALTETDLATLVIFAAIIADGFDYVDQNGALSHLYQIRRNMAVFIDEVQDFTEIEIVLMGMSATSAYNQITLSGDRCQQLQSNGTSKFEHLFPWVPKSPQSRTIFLDHNFRQRSELASLSSGLRSVLLRDTPVEPESRRGALPSTVYRYSDRDRFAEFILKRIRSLPHHATVAVVMPTIAEAQIWFDILNEDLSSYHRAALMSRRDDLTKRVNVHFTEVRETKGLEFDVVIVPDLGSYELDTFIGRNQMYVAISRAKQSLLVGSAANRIDRPEIRQLEQAGLITIREAL